LAAGEGLAAGENLPVTGRKLPLEAKETLAFRTACWFWWRLGCISFGGPAGQIAILHAELVERRRWISEQRFLHALNYCMLLPGPEAQQLATYIGWLLHGVRGGLVAGGFFILPSLVLLLALSALYVTFGQTPAVEAVLWGVKPAVVAIVLAAVWRLGRRAIKTGWHLALAAAAFIALTFFHIPFPIIVLVAALIGWLLSHFVVLAAPAHGPSKAVADHRTPAIIDDDDPPPPHAIASRGRFLQTLLVGAILWIGPVGVLLVLRGTDDVFTQMVWLFTTAALVTFGGAYAVLPFVAQQAVDVRGWLERAQMVDGLALGETTPGPLIMVVSFVGFVAGWQASELGWAGALLGSLLATYFTFLPSFVFILLGGPLVERMRGQLRFSAALTGITAAVVGVVLHLAYYFGREVFWKASGSGGPSTIDWSAVAIAAATLVALVRFKASLGYVVAMCAILGILHGVRRA
jgi:chromate transporter